MNKEKLTLIKKNIEDISPISLGMFFWWMIAYVVTYLIESPFEAKWFVLFIAVLVLNVLAISYGRQWLLFDRRNESNGYRQRTFMRWMLSIVLCLVFNYIYWTYTKWQVILIYFGLGIVILLAFYANNKLGWNKKKRR
jgi:uncharacterized membrane protein